ncbi:MAG: hypothetical protein AB8B53_03055 [Flavobacteriales bacterium]
MKISGFSMVKNAESLFFPIKEAIESILPVVDEFVLALGDNLPEDKTEEIIASIASPKLRVVRTVWDLEKYPNGTENAHQTDIAKSHCNGDWLFYVQADEVVHEQFHAEIKAKCKQYLNDSRVEGFLFKYKHFWGDFDHYHFGHGWYKHEIRLVRNLPDVHSWESAQSFRRIPNFDGKNYRQQAGTYKLKVILIDAYIYHYGWVRPPHLMQKKKKALDTIHKGEAGADKLYENAATEFNYGPLGRLVKFEGTHPSVMADWIKKLDWQDQLNYSKEIKNKQRKLHKHERLKTRVTTFIENTFLGGRTIGGFKNYILLRK